mmetsp:Transcript_85918/g.136501  ORF Transcript_85918/g.136501 Transcript_85918/m.136501 type:complete len:217 (-) Transcript_85918:38-688(-)
MAQGISKSNHGVGVETCNQASACQLARVGQHLMVPNRRPFSGSHIFWLLYISVFVVDADWYLDQSSGDCKASFLQHGIQLHQVSGPAGHQAIEHARHGAQMLNNTFREVKTATHSPKNFSRNLSFGKGNEEDSLLLNQLVALSLTKEGSTSTVSTIINIVVLALLVALIVLLCRHDMNLEEARTEVQEDPRILYKQFEQNYSKEPSVTRRLQETCC